MAWPGTPAGRDQQGRAFLASNTEKQETQKKYVKYV